MFSQGSSCLKYAHPIPYYLKEESTRLALQRSAVEEVGLVSEALLLRNDFQ